ncbi:TWiK family of potassium channels protein 7 [Aphelenchoides bicaudatus]|nr:TWiK family of potassium channels protein 7 [Aphelenchoides bicaudatus]
MIKTGRYRSTLRRRTKDTVKDETQPSIPIWKKYARIVLPHVGLILISCVYIVGGACIFYFLESPNELATRAQGVEEIKAHRDEMLNHLWMLVNDQTMSRNQVEQVAANYIDNATRILFEAFDTHYISAAHLQNTNTTGVENSWTLTTSIFFTTTLLTTIGYGNQAPVTTQGRLICIFYALFGVPLILITVADLGKFLSENIIWLYTLYADRRKKKDHDSTSIGTVEDEVDQEKKELAQLGLEHYITIPILLIATILLGYMLIGAVVLARFEKWSFFEGFYFSFITMTTCWIWRYRCIDLVGLQYIRKIHYFNRKVQDARYALVNVGGKMIHVSDVLKYANVLQQKYGQKKGHGFMKGPYIPADLEFIRFIDYNSTRSSLNSLTSLISSLSGIFTKSTKSEPSMV